MDKDLVSVIIPAYNAETTITRCINSIQIQTYSNLEIIVVNDGSTDNTKEIVKRLQERDDRIKLFTTKNGGVSHARNVGIDNASGDYITFVDADDYIDPPMYEKLLNTITKYGVKIAQCSYKNVDQHGKCISKVGGNSKIIELHHDQALECLILGSLFSSGLWNKMYARELFNDIRLNENIKYCEDLLVNFCLFDIVDRSVYIDSPLYNYVFMPNSSTHGAVQIRPEMETLYVFKEINKMCSGKKYEDTSNKSVASKLLGLYRAYLFANKSKEDKNKLMKEILEYKNNGYYRNKNEKILLFLYRFFPKLFLYAYNLYDKIRVKKLDPKQ